MIKLSKRLSTIASLVPNNSIVADIGCDHALLDIYLTLNKISKKSYACDIVDGAIKQANINKDKYNAKNVIIRKANGLDAIDKKDMVNTIIMSGLGNITIINIIKDNINKLENINNIIIQSNTNVCEIRRFFTSNGYYIKEEKQVLDNKIIYTAILFVKGQKKYNKKELLLGPILLMNKDNLFKANINNMINKNNNILGKIPKNDIIKRIKLKKLNKKLKREIQF